MKNFLHPHSRRRLRARGDTRSILRHPFFKVNWEAVLQKRVTPPVKPPTLEFLNIDPDAPGDGDDLERNPSTENGHHEAILEAPLKQEVPIVLEAPLDQDAQSLLESRLYRRDKWRTLRKRNSYLKITMMKVEETLHGLVEKITEKEKLFRLI